MSILKPLINRKLRTRIFFTSEKYRENCTALWESLSGTEKEFWKGFFAWMSYDTTNSYLVINELQAYLLQQPADEAEAYFRAHRATASIASGTGGKRFERFLSPENAPFLASARRVRQALLDAEGVWADTLSSIEWEERKK